MLDFLQVASDVVAVNEDPELQRLTETVVRAKAAVEAAQVERDRQWRIKEGLLPAPMPETLRATKRWEQCCDQVEDLRAASLEASEALSSARQAAQVRLVRARRPGRQALIRDVFTHYLAAVRMLEPLIQFDQETVAMGGSVQAVPCPLLLRESYQEAYEFAEKDGWV